MTNGQSFKNERHDMAIIVDKEQKKRDIALACKDLFFQKSIKGILISEIATTAGVGKGTIYNYFNNKEEILFEIVNILIDDHDKKKRKNLAKESTTKGKMKVFSDFFYSEDDVELRQLYKDFVAISLSSPSKDVKDFQTNHVTHYYSWMEEIIQEGIDKGEIIPESMNLIRTICSANEGLFIASIATNTIENLEEEINRQIDTIFSFMECKK